MVDEIKRNIMLKTKIKKQTRCDKNLKTHLNFSSSLDWKEIANRYFFYT